MTWFQRDAKPFTQMICAGVLYGHALCGLGAEQAPSRRAYIDYAMGTDGDAARGRLLFTNELRGACGKCHSVDGLASGVGPDLATIGDKFPPRELIRAIMEPSSTIAVGYGTTIVETKDDEDFHGVIKNSTDTSLELKLPDGKSVLIPTGNIKEQRASTTSLMPEGLESGFTLQEFADLVAYLGTLRQPDSAIAFTRGMPAEIPVASRSVQFQRMLGTNVQLRHPSWIGFVPGFTNRLVVLEHEGMSWMIERSASGDTQTEFLDLRQSVRVGGGSGLLGVAFHPRFRKNRRYFVTFQVNEQRRTVTLLQERRFNASFSNDSGEPPRELLRIPGSTSDHVGGGMVFGQDGFLYFGMGDAGPQQDPQGNGQNMRTLLGKMLRIDVDRSDGSRPYSIPSDNPFRESTAILPEIWASGFREPWRFSFDPVSGELWVGDVGQDRVEELAIVRPGENHGWNVFEGFTPFSGRHRRDDVKYTPPVFAYPHRVGVSITAGYVYRGTRAPQMVGRHICGDFESRRMWAVAHTNRLLASVVEIGRAPSRITSFAVDEQGELYMAGYDDGIIYQLDLAAVNPVPREVRTLAGTAERAPVTWRYVTQQPADEWKQPAFDDAAWAEAPGGFGTQGTPGAIVRTTWRTRDIWLRRELTIEKVPGAASTVCLRLHHDEDAEVYLNGIEAARLSRWTSGYVEIPVSPAAQRALRLGRNLLAIHCRQNGGGQYIDGGLVEVLSQDNRTEARIPAD